MAGGNARAAGLAARGLFALALRLPTAFANFAAALPHFFTPCVAFGARGRRARGLGPSIQVQDALSTPDMVTLASGSVGIVKHVQDHWAEVIYHLHDSSVTGIPSE